MATDLAKLVVRLEAQTSRYVQELDRANRKLSRFERNTKKSLGGIERMFRGFGRSIGVALAGFVSAQTISSIVRISDEYTQLNGRLRLVTSSSEELATVQRELFQIAQRTRTEYTGVADLYIKLAQTGSELGATQEELLKFTEGVGNALVVSGSNARSASGALLQLSQALAGGTVRAEEFNSVNEGAPEILRAVARGIDGMDGSIAKLRKAVIEGRISSQDFFRAFLIGSENLAQQAQSLPVTVGQAFIRLQNNINQAIAGADLSPMVDSINRLSDLVADPSFQQGFAKFVSGIVSLATAGANAAANIGNVVDVVTRRFAELTGNISELEKLEGRIKEIDLSLQQDLFRNELFTPTKEKLLELRAELVAQRDALREAWGIGARTEIQKTGEAAQQAATQLVELAGGTSAASDAMKEAAKAAMEQEAALQSIESLAQGLRQQIDTYGQGEAAVIAYRIAHGDLAETFATAGAAAEPYRQELVQLTTDLEHLTSLTQALNAEQQRVNAMFSEGQSVYEATRTPLENYQAEIERLNDLIAVGAIDWDTYNRAVEKSQEAFEKAGNSMTVFAEQASRNVQDILANHLESGFSEGLDGMLRDFADFIRQLVAQAVAADIAKRLFGSGIGSGEGFFGKALGIIGGIFGGPGIPTMDSGGHAMAGQPVLIGTGAQPELFIPDTSGQFVPSGAQGMVVNQHFTIQAPNGVVARPTEQQIAAAAARGITLASRRNN